MAKKLVIRKSVYNQSRLEIGQVLHNESLLTVFECNKNRLEQSINFLTKHDNVALCPAKKSGLEYSLTLEQAYYNAALSYNDLKLFVYRDTRLEWYNGKQTCYTKDKIYEINEQLRLLKRDLKNNFNSNLVQQIKNLVNELYSIISFFFNEQHKYLKRLRVSRIETVIRDIRKTFRQTIQIIFKNLPDFSGCEEEAKFTRIVNFKLLFLNKPIKSCITQNYYLTL